MKLYLHRYFSSDEGTLGKLYCNGQVVMSTLELPWRDNQVNVSCVPPGEYNLVWHNGTKYKNCLALEDVPNRTHILIHTGNTVADIKGCILVGDRLTYSDKGYFLANSRLNLALLMSLAPTKLIISDDYRVED